MQFVREMGGGIGGPRVQPFRDAKRREIISVKLSKVFQGLGGQKRRDHGARRAAKEAPRDRFEHDETRQASLSLP